MSFTHSEFENLGDNFAVISRFKIETNNITQKSSQTKPLHTEQNF